MSSIWGNRIKISIFGESHSEAVGGVFDGIPSGIKLNLQEIEKDMQRRAPGNSAISTPRKEKDEVEILSGYFNGYTTGTPLAFIIKNSNKHSGDYDILKDIMRPGHGDYTGKIRYKGYNDYRGGGHFSGRLTAPLVFIGAIAKQYISEKKKIEIVTRIKNLGLYEDDPLDLRDIEDELIEKLRSKRLPTINDHVTVQMEKYILESKSQGDSVGGIIQCICKDIPPGLGSPFFESFESKLAHLLFSIPAVKGVEFGDGFRMAHMKGSQANDQMFYQDNKILCGSNHNGGITGGITNGMPVTFNVVIKPTPSIGIIQNTINITKKENDTLKIEGRHDPCIIPRALPVVEGCAAITVMDYLMELEGIK